MTEQQSLITIWGNFVEAVKRQNFSLAAILQSAEVLPSSNGVTKIGVYYRFHKEQLEKQKFLTILQESAQGLQCSAEFEFLLLEPKKEVAPMQALL